jgi:alpha-galactosidase
LSLSPGPADVSKADFYAGVANLWRISGDFWDRWQDLKRSFGLLERWSPYVNPGGWPDADMLPLGHIGIRAERGVDRMSLLTHDEQQTLISLWAIARSPLMFGGDLPGNDEFTLSLLDNDEVIAVNQKAIRSRQLFARGDEIGWTSDLKGSRSKYLAVFNIGDKEPAGVRVEWKELGLPANCVVRDLWARKDLGKVKEGYSFKLPPHASGLYRLTP